MLRPLHGDQGAAEQHRNAPARPQVGGANRIRP
jgi:hypothetical protein